MVLFSFFLIEYHRVSQYHYHLRNSFQQFHRSEKNVFGLKNMLLDLSDNFHCLIFSCKQSWSIIGQSFRLVCVVWLRIVEVLGKKRLLLGSGISAPLNISVLTIIFSSRFNPLYHLHLLSHKYQFLALVRNLFVAKCQHPER